MRRDPDPRAPRTTNSRAGFTLIEALAALAVTALIVAVVLPYAGRLSTRWWAGEAAVGHADAWMQAIARMSDDLAEAVPFGIGTDAPGGAAFRAGPESLSFVRPALGHPAALETVSYEIRPSASGSALVRLSRKFDPESFASSSAGRGASATLLDGPLRFRLVEISREGARRRDWTPADGMPTAVELSFSGGRPGEAPAAPIIMPIPARVPAVAGPSSAR